MKRLYPTIWVVLILAAHSVQAQTDAPPYLSNDASVYTDIVGEFEPDDGWIVKPDQEPQSFSQASSSQEAPTLAPLLTPATQQLPTFSARPSPQQIPDWRRTEAGQLWATPAVQSTGNWYEGPLRLGIGVDYLFFSRGTAADNLLAFDGAGDTYSLSDLDPGTDSTLRYRFLIANDGGTGFELLTYEFEEFNGSLSLEGEGITPVFFGLIPAEQSPAYTASYESKLSNFEANIWRRTSEYFKIGFGARYIELEEKFDIVVSEDPNSTTTTTTGSGDSGFFSTTDNVIFGGQLMARIYKPVISNLYLEGGANGGYGFNQITADSDTLNFDSQTEETFGTGFFTFTGGVVYRVMDGLSVRAGYEGLLLTSVALSPDQSTAIDSFNGTGSIQTGSLYFGGAYFGATLSF